jgi:hypothetical protein
VLREGQVVAGDSVQLQVTARFSDGSVADITSRATWGTSNTAVASVSTTGFVKFKQEGDVRISVTFQDSTVAWLVRVQGASSD